MPCLSLIPKGRTGGEQTLLSSPLDIFTFTFPLYPPQRWALSGVRSKQWLSCKLAEMLGWVGQAALPREPLLITWTEVLGSFVSLAWGLSWQKVNTLYFGVNTKTGLIKTPRLLLHKQGSCAPEQRPSLMSSITSTCSPGDKGTSPAVCQYKGSWV